MEARLEKGAEQPLNRGKANRKYISTTDPDASMVRQGPGRLKLKYKIHRAVDERCEVITATDVSPGEKNEGHLLMPLMDQREANTSQKASTAVADSKYGIKKNYLACSDRGVRPHFESFDKNITNTVTRKGTFNPSDFVYNPHEDCFICPAREVLERRKFKKERNHFEYSLSASVCNACPLKPQCTRSKQGRTVKRHIRPDNLGMIMAASQGRASRKDIKERQYLIERTFAQGIRYGYQRSRWRRLWRVKSRSI